LPFYPSYRLSQSAKERPRKFISHVMSKSRNTGLSHLFSELFQVVVVALPGGIHDPDDALDLRSRRKLNFRTPKPYTDLRNEPVVSPICTETIVIPGNRPAFLVVRTVTFPASVTFSMT
jgi:hypothetical protein